MDLFWMTRAWIITVSLVQSFVESLGILGESIVVMC